MCIFFLTFGPKNLIYESHCDLTIANLMLGRMGESLNEERNEESCKASEEKSARKKEEVTRRPIEGLQLN